MTRPHPFAGRDSPITLCWNPVGKPDDTINSWSQPGLNNRSTSDLNISFGLRPAVVASDDGSLMMHFGMDFLFIRLAKTSFHAAKREKLKQNIECDIMSRSSLSDGNSHFQAPHF